QQTRLPDALIVCPATPDDLNTQLLSDLPFTTSVQTGKSGLTAQRNKILAEATAADVIVFFDDDFFPQLNYIEEIERLFVENTDVVAITGRPMMDGANGPGVEAETALKM